VNARRSLLLNVCFTAGKKKGLDLHLTPQPPSPSSLIMKRYSNVRGARPTASPERMAGEESGLVRMVVGRVRVERSERRILMNYLKPVLRERISDAV
jgi:hypothetical protein